MAKRVQRGLGRGLGALLGDVVEETAQAEQPARNAAEAAEPAPKKPRTRRTNWTVSLHSVQPGALWTAHEIVADIQEAYELDLAA